MSRLLGLDFGAKRVGVAFADMESKIAFPLETLHFKTKKELFEKIQTIVCEKQIELLVVGLPLTLSGEKGDAANRVEKRALELKAFSGIPCEFVDESLSTCDAEDVLIAGDVSRKKRKEVVDKLAAQRILQFYLDSL